MDGLGCPPEQASAGMPHLQHAYHSLCLRKVHLARAFSNTGQGLCAVHLFSLQCGCVPNAAVCMHVPRTTSHKSLPWTDCHCAHRCPPCRHSVRVRLQETGRTSTSGCRTTTRTERNFSTLLAMALRSPSLSASAQRRTGTTSSQRTCGRSQCAHDACHCARPCCVFARAVCACCVCVLCVRAVYA